jgi:hypothetical protein
MYLPSNGSAIAMWPRESAIASCTRIEERMTECSRFNIEI